MKAVFKNITLAESRETVELEGNHYFPSGSVGWQYLKESDTEYTCPWKGEARYYNFKTGEEETKDIAWEYPEPKKEAGSIKNYLAFDKDKVEVVS